jgi:hypothetical protein
VLDAEHLTNELSEIVMTVHKHLLSLLEEHCYLLDYSKFLVHQYEIHFVAVPLEVEKEDLLEVVQLDGGFENGLATVWYKDGAMIEIEGVASHLRGGEISASEPLASLAHHLGGELTCPYGSTSSKIGSWE